MVNVRAALAFGAAALLLTAQAAAEAPEGGGQAARAGARAAAQASYERAERAAKERRFAEALAAYREAATADPSAPFAPTARSRADHLAARGEGDFAPLARLEEVRRDPAKSSDRGVIEALVRDAAAFPEGRVRSEARLVAAEALWHRLGDPRRAAILLDEVLADKAADRLTQGLALAELVAIQRELGDLGAALAALDRHPDLAPGLRTEVRRLSRRVTLRYVSIAALAALAGVGALSAVRAARSTSLDALRRRLVSPLSIALALYIGGAAAVLVRLHGGGDARPFLWLGLGVLGVVFAARAWRLGSSDRRPSARAARAFACAAGVLAAAFLALERTDAGYLESFGL
jgi:tetratricopeptide (TPR) repeat protein